MNCINLFENVPKIILIAKCNLAKNAKILTFTPIYSKLEKIRVKKSLRDKL